MASFQKHNQTSYAEKSQTGPTMHTNTHPDTHTCTHRVVQDYVSHYLALKLLILPFFSMSDWLLSTTLFNAQNNSALSTT